MIELERLNVHRIVATQEEADRLIAEGFKAVEPPAEQPPAKPAKAK